MIEEKNKCEYEMYDGELCGRKLYDNRHCIFHSEDVEGKKKGFNEIFWKEFERQEKNEEVYDFSGFIFPIAVMDLKLTIEKKVFFNNCIFYCYFGYISAKFMDDVSFVNVQFKQRCDFKYSHFEKKADFFNTTFEEEVHFTGVYFKKEIYFNGAKFFLKAKFDYVTFNGAIGFVQAIFKDEINFNYSKFQDIANFEHINIEKLNNLKMVNTYFFDLLELLEILEKRKNELDKSIWKTKYLGIKWNTKSNMTILSKNIKIRVGEETTAKEPILSRYIIDDWFLLSFKEKYHKTYFWWWLLADCGRSFIRWSLWSLIFAEIFSLIYWFFYYCNPVSFKSDFISFSWPGISFLYYSIVTFTTLGFGDIVPKLPIIQIIVMIEVILGYIMLGGLISIFANKLARRS